MIWHTFRTINQRPEPLMTWCLMWFGVWGYLIFGFWLLRWRIEKNIRVVKTSVMVRIEAYVIIHEYSRVSQKTRTRLARGPGQSIVLVQRQIPVVDLERVHYVNNCFRIWGRQTENLGKIQVMNIIRTSHDLDPACSEPIISTNIIESQFETIPTFSFWWSHQFKVPKWNFSILRDPFSCC